jgi:hypothetical protein
MIRRITAFSICFLLLICLMPTGESQDIVTEGEVVSIYKSQNSAIYTPNNVRDGAIGVQNQAQLEAKSCDGGCTDDSYAGIYLEIQLKPSDTIVNVSVTYESWAEDSGLGETIPNEYQMSVYINHKFSNDGFLIEETTTGYGNLRTVFIGSFAKPMNNTLIIDYFLLHSDTNSLNDQASARIHEIFIEEGPSDVDNDGVPDSIDQCQTSPSEVAEVGHNGCAEEIQSSDLDGDGVNDSTDNCPNTTENETVDENGCSTSQLDSDNDSVSDKNDVCPGTSSEAVVNFEGCSDEQLDSDGDGVSDAEDGCPDTETGVDVNLLGCSETQLDLDDDGDGIPNVSDDCPETVDGVTVDVNGCEVILTDSDGDGYFDETNDKFPDDGSQWNDSDDDGYGDNSIGFNPDSCPSTYGKSSIDRYGCPDTDKDGYSDENDLFVQNPTQWSDLDGDGFGDNISGTEADKFPDDITQWSDTDNDGYGDNQDGVNADSCVGTFGLSYNDLFGCPDEDTDGISDANDECKGTSSSGGLTDELGCNPSQKDSDNDGVSDSIDECPDSVNNANVLGNGCASSTSDKEDTASGIGNIIQNNLTTVLGGIGTAIISFAGFIIFRRRSAKSVEYLKLAKIASDLTEIQSIRNAIETDLAKGRLDPIVHSRIDSILDGRHKFIVEKMQKTVRNDFE